MICVTWEQKPFYKLSNFSKKAQIIKRKFWIWLGIFDKWIPHKIFPENFCNSFAENFQQNLKFSLSHSILIETSPISRQFSLCFSHFPKFSPSKTFLHRLIFHLSLNHRHRVEIFPIHSHQPTCKYETNPLPPRAFIVI